MIINISRKWTDFIIWNHIFMLFEVYRCIYATEYILFFLGIITTTLSTLRHLYYEKNFIIIEPLIAKMTIIYILLSSIYLFVLYKILIIILSQVLLLVAWNFENINYEKYHPWLHIIVCINIHYYINFYIELL